MANSANLTAVLSKVQPFLAYQSMQFSVSDELQRKTMTQLTNQAIQSYRAQAQRIAKGFMAPSYRILETHINMPNYHSPRPLYVTREMQKYRPT